VTPLVQDVVGPFHGTTFEFEGQLQGRFKRRRFVFVDGPRRMYRMVFDPTSAANWRVLDSLQWLDDRDA
jgi:hypothetical protein